MKSKLLVIELWAMGDLVMATPFLRAAGERFEVTLLARPLAFELQPHLWPEVRLISFTAPWTAFTHKYQFSNWPWKEILRLKRQLRAEHFSVGVSARWDPRDHFLLWCAGMKTRIGFPRAGSQLLLTRGLHREPEMHRYEHWRRIAQSIGLNLPERMNLSFPSKNHSKDILIHTGAAQRLRVWPLERFQGLVRQLRENNFNVQVACDPSQHDWWLAQGEASVAMPRTISELNALLNSAAVFIGNDSGPGHLAAVSGVPTFTLFGPALPEVIAPIHPRSEWIEGKPCPFKPCRDYCRFPEPNCLYGISESEVSSRVTEFLKKNIR